MRPSDNPVKPKGDQAPPNQCVFVSNLPFDINWEELKDLFVKKVDGGIGYVEILVQKNGTSTGQAIVELGKEDLVERAISTMNGFVYKDRELKVRKEREADNRSVLM